MEPTESYVDWLIELTQLGYELKPYLIISTKDKKLIWGYFKEGKSTKEALEAYKEFRNFKPAK